MTVNIVMLGAADLVNSTIKKARDLSDEIIKLADLNISPLSAGEAVDVRRHKLASLGKQLAETFIVVDDFMRAAAVELKRARHNDVTADAPCDVDHVIDPEAN